MNRLLRHADFEGWPGRVIRRVRRRRRGDVITILTWHSVSARPSVLTDPQGLRIDPDAFARQVDYLVRHFRPMSLRDVVTELSLRHGLRGPGEADRVKPHATSHKSLDRAVVLTFDDGYADALRVVAPILYRRRIPMTVFPVTGVIGNHDLLWQHKLAWLLGHGHESRVLGALRVEGFPTPPSSESLSEFARRGFRGDLPAILENVLRLVGVSGPELARELRPYVEPEEIRAADPGFVEFGNHTHSHPILSALTPEEQHLEIKSARTRLRELTGVPPLALAYPFGLKRHYDVNTRYLARETGHRAAVDMRRRLNVGCVDPFELSRRPAPASQREFEMAVEDWPENASSPPQFDRVREAAQETQVS